MMRSVFRTRSWRLACAGLACVALTQIHARVQPPAAPETAIQFLSGRGPEDAVRWEFLCTAGRGSRTWTTVPVPSCWELHGFGTYNYGNEINADATAVGHEQGLYRHTFVVPDSWRDRQVRIVFDGSMTDTSVWVNGQQAGETHQGAFYRFHYDITRLLKFGEPNLLEVTVAKMSANRGVNNAERAADFWVFGGIFRPVWLEARPVVAIDRTAIDAQANGRVFLDVFLTGNARDARLTAQVIDSAGLPVGSPMRADVPRDGNRATVQGQVDGVRPWTAETPHLYRVRVTLESSDGQPLHSMTTRFGFRTIEVRERDGVYLNGTKIVLKGVNRHCAWPETGRTVSREQSDADARLIKEANLNAVRMSHYPPDEHFLDACDELGLYVLDELAGWQKSYGTAVGARLIGEMIRRDINHPSILFWDNGNEGGWNETNDGEFATWDPQDRKVLHPWAVHDGIDTNHYERYDSTVTLSAGPQIFMPTEFLHGLYDGGIGAGLRDYWDVMGRSPTVAGGFLWAWADEGVVRTDQNGRIDTAGNQAPDGIVGPHREKEGSYFSVKEIWSPIQVVLPTNGLGELPPDWDGTVGVANGYDFISLDRCRFEWRLLRFASPGAGGPARTVTAQGTVQGPALAPRRTGTLSLGVPSNWRRADVVHVTARGPSGNTLWTWSAAVAGSRSDAPGPARKPPSVRSDDREVVVTGSAGVMRFDRVTGRLAEWQRGGRVLPLANGPRVAAYRRQARTHVEIPDTGALTSLSWRTVGRDVVVEAAYRGALRRVAWRIGPAVDTARVDYEYAFDGDVDLLGVTFDVPARAFTRKRWLGRGPYRVYRNRLEGGVLDLHEVAYNDPIPGQSADYPEFKGYFGEWQWLQLESAGGSLTVENGSHVPFFGLFGPRDGEPPMLGFPDTGLAFLDVIPAHGTKFDMPDQLGPQSRTPAVSGVTRGSLVLRFASR
ncbi:MAG: glycoside hydrolase family 2 [Acidobacteria bacterium]|nr:glycoside hydrolase family 2 [Acidobacteriota bacterium]